MFLSPDSRPEWRKRLARFVDAHVTMIVWVFVGALCAIKVLAAIANPYGGC